MAIIRIDSLDTPGPDVFATLTEAQLRNRLDPSRAIFIAESPKVIAVAMDAGYRPVSMLCEERHITGDAAPLIARHPDMTVYTGPRDLLATLTGYTLTRGVLCAMHRPAPLPLERICTPSARRIVVIDGVVDTTNIGAIFRSAPALGIDRLHDLGFKTVAMALTDDSIPIDAPRLGAEPRLAIIMGTEGDGLPPATIAAATYTARIPMSHNVDSLNVAAATAVAIWQLR